MKVSSFSKLALLSLLAGVLALALAGCGATSGNNLALTPGNWSVTATSSGAGGTFYIGGNLTQTGSSLAGTMQFVGSGCFGPSTPANFTGTVNGNKLTLTSPSVAGQVITVTGTGTAGASGATVSALTGTYTVAGGCGAGDAGTVTANAVPSINGTWSGPIQDDYENPNAVVSIALTQASTASSDGTFALTGTLTYTNSACFSSGTIQAGSATIAGSSVMINNAIADDGGDVSYTGQLDNPASPTSISGTYSVSDPGENCDGEQVTVTLTKQ